MTTDTDDDILLTYTREAAALILGLLIVSVSITYAINAAAEHQYLPVFIAVFLAWSGYLFSHYVTTGTLIHTHHTSRTHTHDPRRITLALIGFLLTATGIAAWLILFDHTTITAALGGLLALLGYTLTHYALTHKLL